EVVNHPLPDRNRYVIADNVDCHHHHIEQYQGSAGADQQLMARERWKPPWFQRLSPQNVVNYDFERPRLGCLENAGEGERDDDSYERRAVPAHSAKHFAIEPQSAHLLAIVPTRAAAKAGWPAFDPISLCSVNSTAAALITAGTRPARQTANAARPILMGAQIASTTPGENPPTISINTKAVREIAMRDPAELVCQPSATLLPSFKNNKAIRMKGATLIRRSNES